MKMCRKKAPKFILPINVTFKCLAYLYLGTYLLIAGFVNAFVCWRGISLTRYKASLPHHHVIWIVHENAFVKCQTVLLQVWEKQIVVCSNIRSTCIFGLYVIVVITHFEYLFTLIFFRIYAKHQNKSRTLPSRTHLTISTAITFCFDLYHIDHKGHII